MRIYASDDLIGVELGGAVKNIMAIAAGIGDGLGLGLNARAAVLTRGLAEMMRLVKAAGGKPETCMGLTGVGDLILTATGDLSRNRRVGLLLAEGQSLQTVLHNLGHVAEGDEMEGLGGGGDGCEGERRGQGKALEHVGLQDWEPSHCPSGGGAQASLEGFMQLSQRVKEVVLFLKKNQKTFVRLHACRTA